MPQRIVFPQKGQVELQTFDLPVLEPDQLRVRTEFSLMSIGTESIILHQRYAPDTHFARMFSFPQLKTGVQAVGRVEARGIEVSDFNVGDLVYMRAAHGSHQQLTAAEVSPIPATINLKEACWAGLAKTAFRAAWAAQTTLQSDVLIIGAGPVGQLCLRWLAAAGAHSITVVDSATARLAHARRGGGTDVVCSSIEAYPDKRDYSGEYNPPDVVIDTTGNAIVFPHALRLAAKYGKIILVGDSGYPHKQTLTSDVMTKGLTIQATHDSHDRDGWNQRRVDAHFFAQLGDGNFDVDGMITHEFRPEDCEKAYRIAETDRGSTMGVLFDWTGHYQ